MGDVVDSGNRARTGNAPVSLKRWNAKRDANEPAIVDALEMIGVKVYRLSEASLPDLLCYHPRDGFKLLEVKMPKEHLNFLQETTAKHLPIAVVRSVAEALAIFGVVDE